jgi:hypothetical protein
MLRTDLPPCPAHSPDLLCPVAIRASSGHLQPPAAGKGHVTIWNDHRMRNRLPTYTGYSVGCAVVWAGILGALAAGGKKDRLRTILPVFGGWWMGWTSATIARYGYPPPKSRPPWLRNRSD